MLYFRKNKKGFTLIELMVVVAIIGILVLLGARTYSGYQVKAKNAIVKANVGTTQTIIQAELVDTPDLSQSAAVTAANGANMQNPYSASADAVIASNGSVVQGVVTVKKSGTVYTVKGFGDSSTTVVFSLTAGY